MYIETKHNSSAERHARRIVQAVDDTYAAVKDDRHSSVALVHHVETVQLPMRLVTEAEYKESQGEKTWAVNSRRRDCQGPQGG